jgi:hypothetical protein
MFVWLSFGKVESKHGKEVASFLLHTHHTKRHKHNVINNQFGRDVLKFTLYSEVFLRYTKFNKLWATKENTKTENTSNKYLL